MNKKKTVLVISDAHEQFASTASMLRQEGYSVRFENHVRDSLALVGAEAPNLIISELAVPNVDGLQLCRRIKEGRSLSTIPVLLVGDLSNQSSIVKDGFRCGAAGYLQKPIDALKMVDVCHDILSTTKVENFQEQPENLFNAMIANISDAITIIDAADGTILFESPSTSRMFKYEPKELIGKSFFELVHPADANEVTEYFDSIRWNAANTQPVEYRFRQQDGSWKFIESIGSPINDAKVGAAVIVTSREIPEREFTFDGALRNDALRASVFDNTDIGLAMFSSSGHLVESNPALGRLLDYSENEFRNMALSEFIFPYDAENDRRAISEVFDGKRLQYKFENGYLKPTGERIWGDLTIVSIPDNDSYFLMGIFDDPTKDDRDLAFLQNSRQHDPAPINTNIVLDFNGWKVDKGLICEN